MFLRRLTIHNVRSIEHLEIDFEAGDDGGTRKWSFLLGENGTGKSTVLRAVALLMAGSDALSELLAEPDPWIRNGTHEAHIEATIVTAEEEPREIALTLARGRSLRGLYEINAQTLESLDDALRHSTRSYLTLGYGVSRRPSTSEGSVGKRGSRFRHPRAEAVSTLFSADAELNSLEEWAMDVDYRQGEQGIARVRETLNGLLPGIAFDHIDKESRNLMFSTPDGLVPYRQLSDGYQNVAAWTGDMLYQISRIFEDYRRPLEARGLLLVDEIGLHLHPVWQRRLIDFLSERMPNLQIVATTHSPLTVHAAGEGELFFLEREEGGPPVIHEYEGAPRTLMLHQLLQSPVFGLESLDSPAVEAMRDEYRSLRDRESRSEAEERRFRELADQLQDLPEWTEGQPQYTEVTKALREVMSHLEKS